MPTDSKRYGDFATGDRVIYDGGKWQGTLIRRTPRAKYADWMVAWDDGTEAGARTSNLKHAAGPPIMNVFKEDADVE